jgi:hypothetical protein
MPSTSRRRRLAAIAVLELFTSCSHRLPNGGEWAAELAVRPGSTLPRDRFPCGNFIKGSASLTGSSGAFGR